MSKLYLMLKYMSTFFHENNTRYFFTEIPMDLPKTTKRLLLNDNRISSIPAFGLFNRLPNLLSVDLSRNQISSIEEGAFEGAHSIIEM